MTLNERSVKNLQGLHLDLVRVVYKAAEISELDFIVTEGLRTIERQKKLVAAGASKTLHSRHIHGFAVDLAAVVDGEVRWDWPLYRRLAEAMKEAAYIEGIPLEWGGDWTGGFKDGPHFQLPNSKYPDTKAG